MASSIMLVDLPTKRSYSTVMPNTTKIKKAIFPAAGLGTRFLPATKALPKEMLPLVDKPLIQYSIEEAKSAGIEEIIFVTNENKPSIKQHFSRDAKLERQLKKAGKLDLLEPVVAANLKNLKFSYQKEPKGLGHAVLCAKNHIKNEPFAVILGDDIIDAKVPALKQMIEVFKKVGTNIIAVQKVPTKDTHMYGVIKGTKVGKGLYKVEDLVEKPKGTPPSNLAIVGRYILMPEVFKALKNTKKGSGGEIQLTDALRELLKTQDIYAYEFDGTRFDAGDKAGFLEASISLALKRPEFAKRLKKFLKTIDK